ncbi:adenosine receptor A1, partial [Pelobates cultripes]
MQSRIMTEGWFIVKKASLIGLKTEFYSCLMGACVVLILTQSSILALLAIAVDRYLRVKIPTSYRSVVTARRAAMAITGCWVLSFIIGMVPMFGWNNINNARESHNISNGEIIITCQFETVISMEYMVYFNFFVWVLPPLFLMLIVYLEVFNLIQKQLSKKVSSTSKDPQKYYGKELKIAKSLALILLLFALSWLPLHTLNCITLFCRTCEKPMIITYIAIFLSHGNSAMNPIVYAFRIEKFQTTFLYIWKKYFCCKTDGFLSLSKLSCFSVSACIRCPGRTKIQDMTNMIPLLIAKASSKQ